MRQTAARAFAALAACLAVAALPGLAAANPCGQDERGKVVVEDYATGQTAVPETYRDRLAAFAETAKARFGVCIFAQADAQGSEEANARVAQARAEAVRAFLVERGVEPGAIEIATQEKAITLFGLLPEDQSNDRRVTVTHN